MSVTKETNSLYKVSFMNYAKLYLGVVYRSTMPTLQYFSDNGQLLKTVYEKLDETNLQQYLEQNGKDKTDGYMEALHDVLTEMDTIIYAIKNEKIWQPNSDYVTRKKLTQWAEQKKLFLEKPELKIYLPQTIYDPNIQ